MKAKSHSLTGLMSVFLTLPAAADVIYSNLQDIAIPANFGGVYLNVETGAWNADINNPQTGWDINPFYGGSVLWNSPTFQPVRGGTGSMDVVLNLAAGTTIGGGSVFSTFVQEAGGEDPGGPGYGASRTHLGPEAGQFAADSEGYLGFRINGTNYGWMRVVLTDNSGGALIKDWAYDNGGGAVATGNVLQNGAVFTLNSTIGSFSLGSQLTGPNSVVKTGANSATLTNANLYTGATTVSAGTLAVAAAGNLNTSSGVTVAAGANFAYNSTTPLATGLTLEGNGTANRAVLGGIGPINTSVTLDNPGDTLAPGNSPGVQTFTPAQTWSSFSYAWEINNFTGTTPGTDFDQLGIADTLSLTGALGAYHLNVLSLTAGNIGGDVPNFSEIDRSWTVLTTTAGITGFDAANWTIHVDGFTNPASGGFALAQNGNDLVLSYTAVPEPSIAALLGTCGLLALLRRRRACSGGL